MIHSKRLAAAMSACSIALGSFGILETVGSPARAQFGRPITVAVKKVQDNAGASWWRKSYEDKLATMLSTELTNSGHFTVLAREDDALKAIQEEMNMAGINKNTAVKKNNKTQARYIIVASLSDFAMVASSFKVAASILWTVEAKKPKQRVLRLFDLKVIDITKVALPKPHQALPKPKRNRRVVAAADDVLYDKQKKKNQGICGRAVRAGMVEVSSTRSFFT